MLTKNKTNICLFFFAFAAAMAAASFVDLRLDIALNAPDNFFAVWLQRTGEFPCRLICPLAGTAIAFCADKKWLKALGVMLNLGGSAYMGYYIGKHFFIEQYRLGYSLIWGIGFGLTALYVCSFIKIPERIQKSLLAIALISVFVMAFQLITVDVMKMLWGRVRFRDLLKAASFDEFTAWYVINGKTGNKSFPSGHTAGAGMSFLLLFFPYVSERWYKRRQLCFWLPFVFSSLVAFSRLVVGAHYLSDVAVGGAVAFICVLIGIKAYEALAEKYSLCMPGE